MNEKIDIPLPDALQQLLQKPICIPMPKLGKAELKLPTGATIKGMVDVTKAVPDDCSLTFSLILQLAPIMASMECLLRLLKLIKPLVAVVNGLPTPPLKAIKEFGVAAEQVAECLLVPTPAVMIPFVRDLLLLIIKLLRCVVTNLKSVIKLMSGLALNIKSAKADGNAELLATLQCAQDNANLAAEHAMAGIEPVMVILSLAEPFFGFAGQPAVVVPPIARAQDIEGLKKMVATLDDLTKALQLVADALGD
jgi:hypothetical protein